VVEVWQMRSVMRAERALLFETHFKHVTVE
jgi:hypothetical protein